MIMFNYSQYRNVEDDIKATKEIRKFIKQNGSDILVGNKYKQLVLTVIPYNNGLLQFLKLTFSDLFRYESCLFPVRHIKILDRRPKDALPDEEE